MKTLPEKDTEELIPVMFDFAPAVQAGATASPQAVSAEVISGEDANPGAILYGAPTAAGATVVQWIAGGVSGVTYKLRCRAQISDGQILVLAARLPVTTF